MGIVANEKIEGLYFLSVSNTENIPNWGHVDGGVYRRVQVSDDGNGLTFTLEVMVSHRGTLAERAELNVAIPLNYTQLGEMIHTLQTIKDFQDRARAAKKEWEDSQK